MSEREKPEFLLDQEEQLQLVKIAIKSERNFVLRLFSNIGFMVIAVMLIMTFILIYTIIAIHPDGEGLASFVFNFMEEWGLLRGK